MPIYARNTQACKRNYPRKCYFSKYSSGTVPGIVQETVQGTFSKNTMDFSTSMFVRHALFQLSKFNMYILISKCASITSIHKLCQQPKAGLLLKMLIFVDKGGGGSGKC